MDAQVDLPTRRCGSLPCTIRQPRLRTGLLRCRICRATPPPCMQSTTLQVLSFALVTACKFEQGGVLTVRWLAHHVAPLCRQPAAVLRVCGRHAHGACSCARAWRRTGGTCSRCGTWRPAPACHTLPRGAPIAWRGSGVRSIQPRCECLRVCVLAACSSWC